MTRLPPLIALTMVLAVALPAQAETRIYKWVDEDGVTQYTQHPPPAGEAQEVDPETGVGTPAEEAAGSDTDRGDDGGANGEEETAASDSDGEDTIEEYCARIRERVELLAGDEEVRLERDDGTLETLDDEARADRRTELEAQIAEHCED